MRKGVVVWGVIVWMAAEVASAQVYRFDAGAHVGVGYYMGDLNELSFYHRVRESYGVVFRYNHNFRSAVKLTATAGCLSGSGEDYRIYRPEGVAAGFSTNLVDVAAMYEFNFFHYSDGFAYLGARRFSPYVTVGLGATIASVSGSTVVAPHIPFGIGVKYKLRPRLNVGCEVSFRMTFTDQLDGEAWDDPRRIESSSLKNNDWYSFSHVFITYEFGRQKKICNNIVY